MNRIAKVLAVLGLLSINAYSQAKPPSTPSQSINANFADINRKVLEMAQDFPEDKYSYSPGKDLRSFGAVIVHIASGNIFGAKAGRGGKSELG